MGLSCKKQTGKFQSIMGKVENELAAQKGIAKDLKKIKNK